MITMHKKILTISLALAMSISPAASVYADREDDLRHEQAWTAEQLDAAYAQIDNMYARKQQLAAEINSLDADLVNVMVSIQTLENDIASKGLLWTLLLTFQIHWSRFPKNSMPQ